MNKYIKYVNENTIIILDKKAYKKENIIAKGNDYIRLCDNVVYGIIHHNGNKVYPQVYSYKEPWDNHCCGDWLPVVGARGKKEINKQIKTLKEELAKLEAVNNLM